ncbi:MAG: hypothetical protein KF863_06415 [Rubrivivax sp.]|nr:hypothetical protein [Rubrivivax sp.]
MKPTIYSGRRFRRALGHLLVGRAAQAAATIALALLAIRALGPTEYGLYMVLLGIVDLCHPLSSLGLLPTAQQFLPEMALHARATQLRRFVRWLTLLRVAALLAFAGTAYAYWDTIASWLGFDAAVYEGAALACLLIVTLLGAMFTETLLESLLEQRFVHASRALYGLGRLAGLLLLMAFEAVSVVHMLWIDVGLSVLRWAGAEIVLVRQLRRLHPDGSREFHRSEVVRFGWHLSGAQVMNAAASPGALRAIVAGGLGVDLAGHFAFAQQLLKQATQSMPTTWLANVVRPMLIARHRSGDSEVVALSGGLLWKINLGFALAIVGMTSVGGDPLMVLLSGDRIPDGGALLTLVMLAGVALTQNQVSTAMMHVYRYSSLARAAALAALLVPVLVVLGARTSLDAAAAGLALGTAMMALASLVLLQRQTHRVVLDRNGLVRLAFALAFAVAAGVLAARWGLGAAIAAFLAAYALALRAVRPLNAQEFEVLQRIAGRPLGLLAWLVRPPAKPAHR